MVAVVLIKSLSIDDGSIKSNVCTESIKSVDFFADKEYNDSIKRNER